MTDAIADAAASGSRIISPLYVRISHWLNALAAIIMIMSGLRIYNASPIFDFVIPKSLTIGGWLGGAILWHFAAMWLLMINGLFYLAMNIWTGRMRTKFFPIRIPDLLDDSAAFLKGKLAHDDLSKYNSIQKLAYVAAMSAIFILILSGLAIWKPVQFPFLSGLMGGFDNARIVHFFAMAFVVAFVIVHLVMVAVAPRTLLIMTRGR